MVPKCFGTLHKEMLQILGISIFEIGRERMQKVESLKETGSLPDGLLRTGIPQVWLGVCFAAGWVVLCIRLLFAVL